MKKTFRTLELSEKFYHKTENLRLAGNLRDQPTTASPSIALNLVEGNAKQSVKEKRRYYQTANALLKECQSEFFGGMFVQTYCCRTDCRIS